MIERLAQIDDQVWIASQVPPGCVDELVQAGFAVVVNHRPDHEEPGQPTAAALSEAFGSAELKVVHAPVRGLPDEAAVAATRSALSSLPPDGKALFFCRSGLRSAAAWAMARNLDGADPETLRTAAAAIGYDLDRLPLT